MLYRTCPLGLHLVTFSVPSLRLVITTHWCFYTLHVQKYWHYLHSEPPHDTLLCSLLVIEINRCSSCKNNNNQKIHAALCKWTMDYSLLYLKHLLIRSSLHGIVLYAILYWYEKHSDRMWSNVLICCLESCCMNTPDLIFCVCEGCKDD